MVCWRRHARVADCRLNLWRRDRVSHNLSGLSDGSRLSRTGPTTPEQWLAEARTRTQWFSLRWLERRRTKYATRRHGALRPLAGVSIGARARFVDAAGSASEAAGISGFEASLAPCAAQQARRARPPPAAEEGAAGHAEPSHAPAARPAGQAPRQEPPEAGAGRTRRRPGPRRSPTSGKVAAARAVGYREKRLLMQLNAVVLHWPRRASAQRSAAEAARLLKNVASELRTAGLRCVEKIVAWVACGIPKDCARPGRSSGTARLPPQDVGRPGLRVGSLG